MNRLRGGWSRITQWAYDLQSRRRWQLWIVLALLAATLSTILPMPWRLIFTIPVALFGILLFDSHARRQRDETKDHTSRL